MGEKGFGGVLDLWLLDLIELFVEPCGGVVGGSALGPSHASHAGFSVVVESVGEMVGVGSSSAISDMSVVSGSAVAPLGGAAHGKCRKFREVCQARRKAFFRKFSWPPPLGPRSGKVVPYLTRKRSFTRNVPGFFTCTVAAGNILESALPSFPQRARCASWRVRRSLPASSSSRVSLTIVI